MRILFALAALFPGLCTPIVALAQGGAAACSCPAGVRCLCVSSGYNGDLPDLIWRVVIYMSYAIGAFATTCFIVGGFMVVISRGQEPYLPRGKALMIESLIGLGLVLAAQGILRLVVWVLYAPA